MLRSLNQNEVSTSSKVCEEIRNELLQAMANWPPHNSAHEAYAVLHEELDELWEHVKTNQKRRDIVAMRKKCIQVAAMAARFAIECCESSGNGYGK